MKEKKFFLFLRLFTKNDCYIKWGISTNAANKDEFDNFSMEPKIKFQFLNYS